MIDIKFLEIRPEDLEMIRHWRNSPDVNKYMFTDTKISKSQQIKWFERISNENNSRYWIVEVEKKKIGVVYLFNIDLKNSKCIWGFYLGDTSIRGKGIGSKIKFKLLTYVFEELKLNKLYGEILPFNEKSIKMHEKFGFTKEGYLRNHISKNGSFIDVIFVGLLQKEWYDQKESLYSKIFDF
jgi:UDP-4-amino-4,6-dideoxy-N-acetyl-beta-L-altrosamine N-acetyltransferase